MTVSSGLVLAKFQEETVETLSSHLPNTANLHNPVDVIGDAAPDRYENAIATVLKDEGVDAVLVILTPQSMTNSLGTAEAIERTARRTDKPIVCCFMGIVDVSAGVKYLQKHGIPVYKFPENAAKSMVALYQYSSWLNRHHLAQFSLCFDKEKAAMIIQQCLNQGRTKIGENIGYQLLNCYGFKTTQSFLAKTAEEAAEIAEAHLLYPAVVKIASPQILHKTDAGGVMLGLKTADQVRAGYYTIVENALAYNADANIEGVLVQRMADNGVECILGANRVSGFGPLLVFGLGGIFVEVFQDVSFRLAPIGRNEANRMIRSIKGIKLLKAFRGRPETDFEAIQRSLVSLSELMMDHPEITELDINPLIAHGKGGGVTVTDCRFILSPPDKCVP
jgi:acetate---CoA ligase (ADP-forming)